MSLAWNEEVPPAEKGEASARAVFLAWERLRIVYGVILTAVTLIAGRHRLGDGRLWTTIVIGTFGANLCFCVGPIAEGYFDLLGMPRKWARRSLFVAGTLLAVALTLGLVAGVPGGFPWAD